MRAIVAEGNAASRSTLKTLVAESLPEITLTEAATLTAVVRALVEHHPVRLVILDMALPGLNGFQGVSDLRRLFPDIRCLLLVSAGEAELAETAIRLGADGVIPAHHLNQLPLAISAVLAGQRYLPAPDGPAQSSLGTIGPSLTPRERDIVRLLREGLPNKVIANRLAVSEVTVKSHLGKVFRKLGVRNRLQALRIAVEAEWA